jgi:cell wall-associated NlpC family hydrolase
MQRQKASMLNQSCRESIKNFVARARGVPFRERGRDFSGCDCWGLICLAYREVLGLDLPALDNLAGLSRQQAGKVFAQVSAGHRPVPPGQERPGDVVLFRGRPAHAGLVVRPGLMLHAAPEINTCIESYRGGAWKDRLLGIYRHAQLA